MDNSYRVSDFDAAIVAAKTDTSEETSTQREHNHNSSGSLSKKNNLSLDTIFK